MKKVLAAAVGVLAAASLASADSIVNSKHNLTSSQPAALKGSQKGDTSNTSQICVYCHAPHRSTGMLPLWNRSNPAGSKFTLYSGVNMASRQMKTGFTEDSTSLFCMSCHDGSTYLGGSVYTPGANITKSGAGGAGTAGLPLFGMGNAISGDGNLGTNLSTTHPVNFPVTDTDSQNDLFLVTGENFMGNSPHTAVANVKFPLFKAGETETRWDGLRNTNRSLECGSCHAVHSPTYSPFLRATLAGSAICLGCHNK